MMTWLRIFMLVGGVDLLSYAMGTPGDQNLAGAAGGALLGVFVVSVEKARQR